MSILEVHQSLGTADFYRCNSNSFKSIQFRQAVQHNAKSECHHHSSHHSSNPSISELHVVQAKHNKKKPTTEYRSHGMHKSCYYCGATPSHPMEACPTRYAECYKCRKKGHFKGSCMSKKEEKEMGRAKDKKESRNQKNLRTVYIIWTMCTDQS